MNELTAPNIIASVTEEYQAAGTQLELITAAKSGDGRAYRALVEPHLPVLYRIAARVCSDQQIAEDAVQEALALAFNRLDRYEPKAPFKAYLAAIAVRQAQSILRAERRRKHRELHSKEPGTGATPEQWLIGTEAADRIRAVLQEMPAKRREVVLLRLDAGLSYSEIAQAVGSSESSARVLVHLGIKDLRTQLADLVGKTAARKAK